MMVCQACAIVFKKTFTLLLLPKANQKFLCFSYLVHLHKFQTTVFTWLVQLANKRISFTKVYESTKKGNVNIL